MTSTLHLADKVTMKPSAGLVASLVGLFFLACGSREPAPRSTLIVNATVLDGTGDAPRLASVRLEHDTIVEVGDLVVSSEDTLIDADGLTLTPGFIDTHSHADGDIFELPDALAGDHHGSRRSGRRIALSARGLLSSAREVPGGCEPRILLTSWRSSRAGHEK